MAKKQRLVVCLDGTWNNRDDTTNVLHHFALALKGEPPGSDDSFTQTKYYLEGVGTRVLDGITGGAFGFGLEQNVRDAYDWLVANYHDENGAAEADEIFIFGFSRGAYTARSLIGFIATCGLLRRGAPLSVKELWEDYCIIGREREHRRSFWDRIFGETPTNIQRINNLVLDPWNIHHNEKEVAQKAQTKNEFNAAGTERVPGQKVDNLNVAERLLVRWSRRVRITYLGVYDTVGAMGLDALAIPGLKSKFAMVHNMRATTLIQHCRHALATDEHRPSFSHTPFLEYVDHADDEEDNLRIAKKETNPEVHWKKQHAMWRRKIEQRWFIGAHSNIGGGYPDNELAQRPLEWLLEGARKIGLQSEEFVYVAPTPIPQPRDSFAEFAKPFWTEIIRGKRYYRPIDPDREIRATIPKKQNKNRDVPGFSLQSINEQVDQTVFDGFNATDKYRPPNLVEYAMRKLDEATTPAAADVLRLNAVAAKTPKHTWLAGNLRHLILVLWATFASVGLVAANELFSAKIDSPLPLWLLCSAAFVFALVDWGESRVNFSLAVGPSNACWRAFLDSIYWTRTLGFVLFAFGAIAALVYVWSIGWHADSMLIAWTEALEIIKKWWLVPLAAGLGMVIANLLDGASANRQKAGLLGSGGGFLVAIGLVSVLVPLAWIFAQVFTPLFGYARQVVITSAASEAQLAGLLLLLQLAFVYYLKAFSWVGEPMSRANLGSIFSLQRCWTRQRVVQCLERWRRMLECRWSKEDKDAINGPAAHALRETLRETLWRDIFGFIPVYLMVFEFGLWFAASQLKWQWLDKVYFSVPLWFWVPLIAALADYGEDICHLRYVALQKRGAKPSPFLPLLSFAMTALKFAAFSSAGFITLSALVIGSWKIALLGESTGWRGTVALLISLLVALAIIVVLVGAILYRYRTTRTRGIR
jgi:uncharacterized protein (DUF2235 family)